MWWRCLLRKLPAGRHALHRQAVWADLCLSDCAKPLCHLIRLREKCCFRIQICRQETMPTKLVPSPLPSPVEPRISAKAHFEEYKAPRTHSQIKLTASEQHSWARRSGSWQRKCSWVLKVLRVSTLGQATESCKCQAQTPLLCRAFGRRGTAVPPASAVRRRPTAAPTRDEDLYFAGANLVDSLRVFREHPKCALNTESRVISIQLTLHPSHTCGIVYGYRC